MRDEGIKLGGDPPGVFLKMLHETVVFFQLILTSHSLIVIPHPLLPAKSIHFDRRKDLGDLTTPLDTPNFIQLLSGKHRLEMFC